MGKTAASILVIGAFAEDERMYPHLCDILENLGTAYDEVIYIGDDPQYNYHLEVDQLLLSCQHVEVSSWNEAVRLAFTQKVKDLEDSQRKLAEEIRSVSFRNPDYFVLAIDDNAFNISMGIYPDRTVYWSFDPLGKDCPYRLQVDGFVERLLFENASMAKGARALIVQDRDRERHLFDCLGTTFNVPTIYVPVSLNDTRYCSIAAAKRRAYLPAVLKVVQNGHICQGRYSNEIARSFQKWPTRCELHLRGTIGSDISSSINTYERRVYLSEGYVDNRVLPSVFNEYDVGFIGYRETDRNHHLIINASSQLVAYLRLGMPLICCGADQLVNFVNDNKIGFAVCHPSKIRAEQIVDLIDNYSRYSLNARTLFEDVYDLNKYMTGSLYPALDQIFYLT